jgi:ubiquinol-cytochrome c reductase cytochrome c subunit
MRLRATTIAVLIGLALVAAGCARSASDPSGGRVTSTATQSAYVGNIANGREAFTDNCATCHGATGLEGGVGPSLAGEKARINYDETIAWIENPLPPMPKLYPSPISRETVEDIAAYVQSL